VEHEEVQLLEADRHLPDNVATSRMDTGSSRFRVEFLAPLPAVKRSSEEKSKEQWFSSGNE
jgi:hypothetical protein